MFIREVPPQPQPRQFSVTLTEDEVEHVMTALFLVSRDQARFTGLDHDAVQRIAYGLEEALNGERMCAVEEAPCVNIPDAVVAPRKWFSYTGDPLGDEY